MAILVLQMNERKYAEIEIHSEYSALLNNSESEVASYVSEKYQHVQWIMQFEAENRHSCK